MPKRTNDFQKLVKLLQHSLSGDKVKITESAMMPVEGLDGLREIDVLIEGEIGIHQIKIAVEAKDHKRKLDVTVIESIISKYYGTASIPVNKVMIISSNGFTESAIQKAKSTNIELMTLQKALDYNWEDAKKIQTIGFSSVIISGPSGNNIESLDLLKCNITLDTPCHKTKICHKPCIMHFYEKSIDEYLRSIFCEKIFNKNFRENMIKDYADKANVKLKMTLDYNLPPKTFVRYNDTKFEFSNIVAVTKDFVIASLPVMPGRESPFYFHIPLHISGIRLEPLDDSVVLKDIMENSIVYCTCAKHEDDKKIGTFQEWLNGVLEKYKSKIKEQIEKNQKKIGAF